MQQAAAITKRLYVAFAMIAAVLILVLSGANRASIEQQDGEIRVSRTYEILESLDWLLAVNYELSAGRHALALSESAALDRLQTLTADNPEQLKGVEKLRDIIQRRNDVLDRALQAYRSGGVGGYGDKIGEEKLAGISLELREAISELKNREMALLELRKKRTNFLIAKIKYLNYLLSAIITAGTGILLWRIRAEIHARAALQGALRQAADTSSSRFRALVDHALPGAFFIHDHQGRFIEVNQRACDGTGYGKEELLALTMADIEQDFDLEQAQTEWSRVQPDDSITMFGHHRRKNGGLYPVEVHFGLLESVPQRVYAAIVLDISERRRIEREAFQARSEMLHASRLSMIGEVASTISHEVNQPLGAVTNFLEAARALAGKSPNLLLVIEKAQAQARRASEVVRKVRSFAANRALERQPTQISPLIEDSLSLARLGNLTGDIEPTLHIPESLPKVRVDRVQIQQILINLIRNAGEAMEGSADKRLAIEVRLTKNDSEIEIIVADNGPGINDSMRERLFQSFATTKNDGTGLGLSTSRAIAQAHGGNLALHPTRSGAAFILTLPIGHDDA